MNRPNIRKTKKRMMQYKDFIISYDNLPDVNINKFKSNALRENSLNRLVQDHDNHPIPSEFLNLSEIENDYCRVKDQQYSPTCWIYSLISFYETIFNKKYIGIKDKNILSLLINNIEHAKSTTQGKSNTIHLNEKTQFSFSVKYVFFFHIYEQTNKCFNQLRHHIYNDTSRFHNDFVEVLFYPIYYGGQENDCSIIIHKYGLVPETEYPSSRHLWNSTELEQTCTSLLKMAFYELVNSNRKIHDEIHQKTLKSMYHTLVMFLGEPPKKISLWRENLIVNNLTPLEFYRQYSPIKTDELVVLVHHNEKVDGVYKSHETLRNITREENIEGFDRRLNLRYRYISNYIKKSIDNQIPVPFACDICRDHDVYNGYCDVSLYQFYEYLEIPFKVSRKSILRTFDRWGPHAMMIVGYYTDKRDPNKKIVMWKVMNSWGNDIGTEGFIDIKAEWMEFNSMYFHIDKNLLSQSHIDMWKKSIPKKMEKNDLF